MKRICSTSVRSMNKNCNLLFIQKQQYNLDNKSQIELTPCQSVEPPEIKFSRKFRAYISIWMYHRPTNDFCSKWKKGRARTSASAPRDFSQPPFMINLSTSRDAPFELCTLRT